MITPELASPAKRIVEVLLTDKYKHKTLGKLF